VNKVLIFLCEWGSSLGSCIGISIFHILIFKSHQRTRGIGLTPYFVLQFIVCFELGIVHEYIFIYVHNFMCVTLLVLIVFSANLGATYLCSSFTRIFHRKWAQIHQILKDFFSSNHHIFMITYPVGSQEYRKIIFSFISNM